MRKEKGMTLLYPLRVWHTHGHFVPAMLVRNDRARCYIIAMFVDSEGQLTIRHLHRVRTANVWTVERWREWRSAQHSPA